MKFFACEHLTCACGHEFGCFFMGETGDNCPECGEWCPREENE